MSCQSAGIEPRACQHREVADRLRPPYVPPGLTSPRSRFTGALRLGRLLGGVLSAQTIAQALTLLSGLAVLRWLSVEEYAQYTLVFGFFATLSALVDLGVAGAVMPLVRNRAHDAAVVGGYLRATLHLRALVATIILPISAVAFFVMTAHRGWGSGVQLGLFATVALCVWARAMIDIYALPLLMAGAYRSYYSGQIYTAILRLGTHGLLQVTRGLSGVSASLINGLAALANGTLYRRLSCEIPAKVDPARSREIRRLAAPAVPGLIFYAFQSQITILLVSVFGRTKSIAEVGALSRFAALFVILGGIIQVLIAPRFPQLPRNRLVRRTAQVIGVAVVLGMLLTTIAFVVPEPLLYLLGPDYGGLRLEAGWYMVGASFAFLSNVLYVINLARRFIWWWSTALCVSAIVVAQLVAAATLDLGSTLELQYFAVLTGAAACSGQLVALVWGLRAGPRTV